MYVGLQRCLAICMFAYTCAALSQMPSAFFVSHLAHGRRAGLRFLFSPCKYEAYVFMPLLAICLGSSAARHVDAMRSLRRTRNLATAWSAPGERRFRESRARASAPEDSSVYFKASPLPLAPLLARTFQTCKEIDHARQASTVSAEVSCLLLYC